MSPKAFGDDRDTDLFEAMVDGGRRIGRVRHLLGPSRLRAVVGTHAVVRSSGRAVITSGRSESILRRRGRRRWLREVTRELQRQHVTAMSALLDERIVSGSAVMSIVVRGGPVLSGAELVFADDRGIGLSLCHAPTLDFLVSAGGDTGTTTLVRARHHGTFWALYFQAGWTDVAVLAADVYPVPVRD